MTWELFKDYWALFLGVFGLLSAWVKYEFSQTSNITRLVDTTKALKAGFGKLEAEQKTLAEHWSLSTDQVQDEGSQLRRLVKEQGEQISRLKSAQQHHILKFNALTIVIESCMNRKGLTIDIFRGSG